MQSRRNFLKQASMTSLGFMGLSYFACSPKDSSVGSGMLNHGLGELKPDLHELFTLPEGFSLQVISRWKDPMNDGLLTPNRADGMAAFPGPDGKVILVRNHEISTGDLESGAYGDNKEKLGEIAPEAFYDYGQGENPCLGGTTTMVFNEEKQELESVYMSLAGTIRNCAGGPTPWGSWITCEETMERQGDNSNEKDHGYNFEVPARADGGPVTPVPLKAMGRFNHEAVCVDPRTGIVYQTEDRGDGLIYRFIPNVPGELDKGGKLQALVLLAKESADLRNWTSLDDEPVAVGEWMETRWIDLDEVESPEDDLRYRGFAAGAARFARGEGMWFGDQELYFACTNGGSAEQGQVFRYQPSQHEGTDLEAEAPGRLQLFAEPNDSNIVQNCDNLTVAPWGDVFLCEDHSNPRLIWLTKEGEIHHFAHNIGRPESELAGVCFSPSGKTLFVSIQHAGITVAITGPWEETRQRIASAAPTA